MVCKWCHGAGCIACPGEPVTITHPRDIDLLKKFVREEKKFDREAKLIQSLRDARSRES